MPASTTPELLGRSASSWGRPRLAEVDIADDLIHAPRSTSASNSRLAIAVVRAKPEGVLMTWVRLDDNFPDHRKVNEAGPLAMWLWVCGLCYCGRLLSDGFIPRSQVRKLADVDDAFGLANRLVDVGLWEKCDDGYRVHDYLDYNPSRQEVEAERAKKVAAGQAGGRASAQARGQASASAGAQAKSNPVPVPGSRSISRSHPNVDPAFSKDWRSA